ncbi:collagen alpha-2(I) chain-like [Panthera uncia]|uniref:collagen alpha-2(I) chain-like n=1 Tax=Panthera uncia TaxID=29064 RepID=UPI0020FFBDB5|nr:collagen alpha-2(I) chain-like [Panthera uncia]
MRTTGSIGTPEQSSASDTCHDLDGPEGRYAERHKPPGARRPALSGHSVDASKSRELPGGRAVRLRGAAGGLVPARPVIWQQQGNCGPQKGPVRSQNLPPTPRKPQRRRVPACTLGFGSLPQDPEEARRSTSQKCLRHLLHGALTLLPPGSSVPALTAFKPPGGDLPLAGLRAPKCPVGANPRQADSPVLFFQSSPAELRGRKGDEQLDSRSSARANMTSPASSQLGLGPSSPLLLPFPLPPGLELGLGRVLLPKPSPPAGGQARAVLCSELAFSEAPAGARGWPAAPAGRRPEAGVVLREGETSEDLGSCSPARREPRAGLSAFSSKGRCAGPRAVSGAVRSLDSPGLEMVGNCSWEAHPGDRNKASAGRQQRGSGHRRAGCGGRGRRSPGPPPPALCRPGPSSVKGRTGGRQALWTVWPPRSPVSSSVRQAQGTEASNPSLCRPCAPLPP